MAVRRPLKSTTTPRTLVSGVSGFTLNFTSTNNGVINVPPQYRETLRTLVGGNSIVISGTTNLNGTYQVNVVLGDVSVITIIGNNAIGPIEFPSALTIVLNDVVMQEMTDAEISSIQTQMVNNYLNNPAVYLGVVGGSGNLGTYYDTRLQAGAYLSYIDRYPYETETAEPSVVTIGYARVNEYYSSVSQPFDNYNLAFPLYYDGSNLRAMSYQDLLDTFVYPVVNQLVASDAVYTVSTSSSVSGYTLISGTPIYSDTRADTSAYTWNGIPEALDQAFTVNNYYLHKKNAGSSTYTPPLFSNTVGTIYTPPQSVCDSLLNAALNNTVVNDAGGYKIRHGINTAGNTNGTGMTDTRLNGAGNYQTYYVNTDDYRAQEFPDGSAVAIGTYYLRTRKA